jgi:transcriptional regulator with XRE-family HTH domain
MNIRASRLSQALTQAELADKVGVSQATVSNWEKGTSGPDASALESLTKVLGPLVNVGDGAGANAFGAWLRRAREAAKLSVPELATAAGMSSLGIQNLESGVSQNPQAKTREKLEKALRTPVPDEVKLETENEQRIEGLGTLKDFDPHKKDDWPTCPGIYVFYDVSDRPIYVGQGQKISARVANHEDKFWFKHPIVSHAAYIEVAATELRTQVEQVLIKFLKSNAVLNKQHVDRGE